MCNMGAHRFERYTFEPLRPLVFPRMLAGGFLLPSDKNLRKPPKGMKPFLLKDAIFQGVFFQR